MPSCPSTASDVKATTLTRNAHSAPVKSPSSRGLRLVEDDLSERDSVLNALKDVDVAHLVTDFHGPKGVDGETEQGNYLSIVLRKQVSAMTPSNCRHLNQR
jgi:hypothetical protein